MGLNMDFYEGNQFTYINKQTKNIEEAEKIYWYQEMEVLIRLLLLKQDSKLGRLRPF